MSRCHPYYTRDEILLLAEHCPKIRTLCFKYNPKYLTNFIDLAVFENLSSLEIWGGEYYSSNLFFLLETIGHNLTCLHLCHVEQLSCQSLLHLAFYCNRQSLSIDFYFPYFSENWMDRIQFGSLVFNQENSIKWLP